MATYEEREKARFLIQKAVADGLILKPKHCEKCGKETPSKRLHGHHSNYAKPSQITWLCISCHGWAHRFLRWFEDRLQWLEYCKEKRMDADEGLLPQLHKKTGLPLKTSRFEYWRVNLRAKWRGKW